MQSVKLRLSFIAIILFLTVPCSIEARVVYDQKTEFNHLILQESNGLYCLMTENDGFTNVQGCVHPKHPLIIATRHTRALMSALFLEPQPKRVLIVGMGLGVLPMAIRIASPNAYIETVEVDPDVIKIATELFHYEEDAFTRTYTIDGPTFVKRAKDVGVLYDIVVINALTAKYLPDEMMSREFLEAVRDIMTEGAVIVANTLIASKIYDNESVTYNAVFGDFYNYRTANGHRIIVATNGPGPSVADIQKNAMSLSRRYMDTFGININDLLTKMDNEPDWEKNAKTITEKRTATDIVKGPIRATIEKHKMLYVMFILTAVLLPIIILIKIFDVYVAKKGSVIAA